MSEMDYQYVSSADLGKQQWDAADKELAKVRAERDAALRLCRAHATLWNGSRDYFKNGMRGLQHNLRAIDAATAALDEQIPGWEEAK